MPKLTACVAFYNNAAGLELMCKTVRKIGLPIVAVDGKFKEFRGPNIYSTDGSIDVARKYADVYIPADESFLTDQCAKRNRYVQEIKTGEYFLAIDDDEALRGTEINTDELDLDTYSLRYIYPAGKVNKATIRVHKKYDDLIYAVRHCYLYYENQMNLQAVAEMNALAKDAIVTPELAHRILEGCKTCRYEPNVLKGKNNHDITIIHYPERRGIERQHNDDLYTSQRKEYNLNIHLKAPSLPTAKDMPTDIGQDVDMQYQGTESFNDGQFGTLQPGDVRRCSYAYALKLREDFAVFEIIKIHPTPEEKVMRPLIKRIEKLEKKVKALENLNS